jgi:hypothetical protein
MPRFQAGSRYAERVRVVVTIVVTKVVTKIVTKVVINVVTVGVSEMLGRENPQATKTKPVASEARPVP